MTADLRQLIAAGADVKVELRAADLRDILREMVTDLMAAVTTPAAPPADDALLSRKELIGLSGMSEATIDRAIARKELAAIRIGSRVMVRRSAYDAWLAARESRATAAAPEEMTEEEKRTRVQRALARAWASK